MRFLLERSPCFRSSKYQSESAHSQHAWRRLDRLSDAPVLAGDSVETAARVGAHAHSTRHAASSPRAPVAEARTQLYGGREKIGRSDLKQRVWSWELVTDLVDAGLLLGLSTDAVDAGHATDALAGVAAGSLAAGGAAEAPLSPVGVEGAHLLVAPLLLLVLAGTAADLALARAQGSSLSAAARPRAISELAPLRPGRTRLIRKKTGFTG